MEFFVRSQLILAFIFLFFNGCQYYEEKTDNYQLNDLEVHSPEPLFNLAHFKVLLWKDYQEALSYRDSRPINRHDRALSELELIDKIKSKEPSVKVLERLSRIDIKDLPEVEHQRYADILFKFIEKTPRKTMSSYKNLSYFIEPWLEAKSLLSLIDDQNFKLFFKKVHSWQTRYKEHQALQIILGDFHAILDIGIKEVNTLALVAKDLKELQWLDEFAEILDKKSGQYKFICLQDSYLDEAFKQLTKMNVDLVLLSGYSIKDFNVLSTYSFPLPSIALMDPFDNKVDNLWFFPSREYSDTQKIKQLVNLDKGIYIIGDSPEAPFDITSSRYIQISDSNYKERILESLEVPNRKAEFQKYIYTSIDYLPLPSREYSTVVLETSKELARLSYPYWKLKSPCFTTFIGRGLLLEGDVNLDRSLKGMILPKFHYAYKAKPLFELISNFRSFLIDKSFTLIDEDKVVLRRDNRVFLQEDQFVEYQGS